MIRTDADLLGIPRGQRAAFLADVEARVTAVLAERAARGGKALAAKRTPAQRKESARLAARARWAKK